MSMVAIGRLNWSSRRSSNGRNMNSRTFAALSSTFWIVAAFGLVLFTAGPARAQVQAAPPFVKAAHRDVIAKWLASKPALAGLRVGTDRDCRNKSGLAEERKENRNYQPYYAVGDFNHDRNEDFAVVFVNDRKRRNKFSMAIFNGPFTSTSLPAYFVDNSDLSMVGFSWDQGEQNYLLQGEFQSDFCWLFKPRGKTYKVEDCLED